MFDPPYYFYLFQNPDFVAGGFGDTKIRAVSIILNNIKENKEAIEKKLLENESMVFEHFPELLVHALRPESKPIYAKCPKFGFYREIVKEIVKEPTMELTKTKPVKTKPKKELKVVNKKVNKSNKIKK